MDPKNNQNQPVNPINSNPVSVPPSSPAPEQVGNPVQKTDKKFLLYGVLIGLVVVAVVGVAGFYMMFGVNKDASEVSVVSSEVPQVTTTPVSSEVSEVKDTSDLDNLIVGLAQADGELDKELEALEKDSDF